MARPTLLAAAVTSGLSFSQMPWYAHLLLGLAALAVVVYEQTLRYRSLVKLTEKFGRVGSSDIPHVIYALSAAVKPRGRADAQALRTQAQPTPTAAASDMPAPDETD